MPSKYVVLDLETTGLETTTGGPGRIAEPIEIAAILYDQEADLAPQGKTINFVPAHDQRAMLETVEFGALATNRYFERRLYDVMSDPAETNRLVDALWDLLDGATVVGANPAYDVAILWPWLRARVEPARRVRPPWRFRLYDVELASAIAHDLDTIPSLAQCAKLWEIGANPAAHTALGDALVTCDVFHAIRTRNIAAGAPWAVDPS